MPQAKSTSRNGNKTLTLEFSEMDRETKNALRFQEDLPKGKDRGSVGSIYLLKADAEKLGVNWDEGDGIRVTIEALLAE